MKGKKTERDIAYYVVGDYVSKQPIERMRYSQKWVCKGFCKKWKDFLVTYGKRAIKFGTSDLSLPTFAVTG